MTYFFIKIIHINKPKKRQKKDKKNWKSIQN